MRREGDKKLILWAGLICFLQRAPHCVGEESRSGSADIVPATLTLWPTVPPAALTRVSMPVRGACLACAEGDDTTRRYPSPARETCGGSWVTFLEGFHDPTHGYLSGWRFAPDMALPLPKARGGGGHATLKRLIIWYGVDNHAISLEGSRKSSQPEDIYIFTQNN